MPNKTYHSINDIRVYDFKTNECFGHFSCPQCINRTQCRHHYEKRQSCDVCHDILSSNNIHLFGHVDAFIDSQFFILKNIGVIKTIRSIFNKYSRNQCQK